MNLERIKKAVDAACVSWERKRNTWIEGVEPGTVQIRSHTIRIAWRLFGEDADAELHAMGVLQGNECLRYMNNAARIKAVHRKVWALFMADRRAQGDLDEKIFGNGLSEEQNCVGVNAFDE